MNKCLHIATRVMLMGGITLIFTQAKAQLKVGTNPTKIEKSAILELEGKKQGLLLTRLDNFTDINSATPPDGMIVFLNTADATRGLYVRKDGNWVQLASTTDAANNWRLNGNAGAAGQFIGTSDNAPLIFKTDGTERLQITADGHLKTGYTNVTAGTAELEVLVLGADGTIMKRTLSKDIFANAVQTLNGLSGALQVETSASTANNNLNVTTDGATKVQINAPVMNGGATQQYGFMTLADWTKLQSLSSADGMTVATMVLGAASGEVDKGARITFDNITGKYKLELIAADATHAGIVTTQAQTFAGEKTFKDIMYASADVIFQKNLNVTGNATISTALSVSGDASVAGNTSINGTLHTKDNVTLDKNLTLKLIPDAVSQDFVLLRDDATGMIYKKQLPATAFQSAIHTINGLPGSDIDMSYTKAAGNDVQFIADNTQTPNTLKLNIPDAAATALRGLVTNEEQKFAGVKKFADSVYSGKSLMVGDTLAGATSTLTVSGSVSMKLRVVTGGTAISADDYTVVVKSAAAATVTLPSAKNIAGRIYTIKKVPAVTGVAGSGHDAEIDNPVTIEAFTGENIEDGPSIDINNDWTFLTVQSDGDKTWYIIKK
ncbi:hypothetical protein [Chitinophaga sp. MM2321]|uniref:hypothetical protein n=1 Tax=Chitinophaga sp. MM2321 TaxID=3137178 RepID=UPI0032D577E9